MINKTFKILVGSAFILMAGCEKEEEPTERNGHNADLSGTNKGLYIKGHAINPTNGDSVNNLIINAALWGWNKIPTDTTDEKGRFLITHWWRVGGKYPLPKNPAFASTKDQQDYYGRGSYDVSGVEEYDTISVTLEVLPISHLTIRVTDSAKNSRRGELWCVDWMKDRKMYLNDLIDTSITGKIKPNSSGSLEFANGDTSIERSYNSAPPGDTIFKKIEVGI